jgi:hypothetical protein
MIDCKSVAVPRRNLNSVCQNPRWFPVCKNLVSGNNNGSKPLELLRQCTFVNYQFSTACNITIALACEAVLVQGC